MKLCVVYDAGQVCGVCNDVTYDCVMIHDSPHVNVNECEYAMRRGQGARVVS